MTIVGIVLSILGSVIVGSSITLAVVLDCYTDRIKMKDKQIRILENSIEKLCNKIESQQDAIDTLVRIDNEYEQKQL